MACPAARGAAVAEPGPVAAPSHSSRTTSTTLSHLTGFNFAQLEVAAATKQ